MAASELGVSRVRFDAESGAAGGTEYVEPFPGTATDVEYGGVRREEAGEPVQAMDCEPARAVDVLEFGLADVLIGLTILGLVEESQIGRCGKGIDANESAAEAGYGFEGAAAAILGGDKQSGRLEANGAWHVGDCRLTGTP
jgi:hypothetical protein